MTINNKITCTKNNLIESKNINSEEIDFHVSLWNYLDVESSKFPCKMDYHYINTSQKYVFDIDVIQIIFDKNNIMIKHKIRPNSLKFINIFLDHITNIKNIIKQYNET